MKRIDYPRVLANRFLTVPRRKSLEWVMVVAQGPQRFTIVCFCPKWGPGCSHADQVLAEMKPWYRQRCRLSERQP